MKTSPILLAVLLAVFYTGTLAEIRTVKLTIASCYSCGGYNLWIQFKNPQNNQICNTRTVQDFSSGDTLQWVSYNNGDLMGCDGFEITNSTLAFIRTSSNNDYKMERLDFWDQDYKKYGISFNSDQWQGQHTNDRVRTITDFPRQVVCPTTEDSCPAHEMRAYEIDGHDQMTCAFECPNVYSTARNGNMDGSGYRCLSTNHPSIQNKWCCLTKATTNIPHCRDVEGQSSPPASCSAYGCPLEEVSSFWSPNEFTSQTCRPDDECDNINMSNLICSQSRNQVRKETFCCEIQTDTDLPLCSQLRGITTQPPPTSSIRTPYNNGQNGYNNGYNQHGNNNGNNQHGYNNGNNQEVPRNGQQSRSNGHQHGQNDFRTIRTPENRDFYSNEQYGMHQNGRGQQQNDLNANQPQEDLISQESQSQEDDQEELPEFGIENNGQMRNQQHL
jgi:hypothetical protein